MARDFNGTTDRIDWAAVANLTGSALTFSAWVYFDNTVGNQYMLVTHDSGNAEYGVIFNNKADTPNLVRHGTTDYNWMQTGAGSLHAGDWHHVLWTSDGGLIAASAVLYVNGVSEPVGFTTGSGAETAHTGSWSLGGRIYSDTRNMDGRIAEVGVWNRVLAAGEIAQLAAAYAPSFMPTGLLFYSSLVRDAYNLKGVAAATEDGTTVSDHARIIYPHKSRAPGKTTAATNYRIPLKFDHYRRLHA